MAKDRKYKKGPWSKEEEELVKKLYPTISNLEIAGKLKRSVCSIERKTSELGLRRRRQVDWSNEEIECLKKEFATTSTWEIANKLDRSLGAVRRKAFEIGLEKKRSWK